MSKDRIIRFILLGIFIAASIPGVIFLCLQIAIPAIVCLTIAVVSAFLALVPYPFLNKAGDNNETIRS